MNASDDSSARIGILSQRTTNLEAGFADLRRDMNQQIAGVHSAISSITTKMDERFTSLAANMAERNKPQWQAIGVALTFAVIIGGMAYWPIRESTTDLKQTVSALAIETNQSIRMLADKAITREEMDWRSARGAEDRARTEKDIDYLSANMVPRTVWEERNHARDTELADVRRRMDEIRQEVGAVYGTRDVIIDLKKEIDNLRQRLNSRRQLPSSD